MNEKTDISFVRLVSYDIDEETGLVIWELAEIEDNKETSRQKYSYRISDILQAFNLSLNAKDILQFFEMLKNRKDPFKWVKKYDDNEIFNEKAVNNKVFLSKVDSAVDKLSQIPYNETMKYLEKKGAL